MSPFFSELTGSAFLIILGNGVVANVVLNKTKGHNSGWIVITFGWAMAVFTAVFISAPHSGAHLNPAVTLALALNGNFDWHLIPVYLMAQFSGTITGQLIVWMAYKNHYDETSDPPAVQATFCTAPSINNLWGNLTTEIIGTFVLILGVLFIVAPSASLGALDALPVALLVLSIGLSLGGPTGYAINPARDLGPRIVYALLPIKNKIDFDWSYSWIPVLGPLFGAGMAVFVFNWLT